MSFSAVRPPQGSPTATTGPNRIQMSYAMRRLQTSRWQAMKFFEHKSKPSRLAGLAWMSCLTCKGNNEIASVTANLMLSSRHWPTSCSKLDMQVNHCEDCLQRCLTNLADCWDLKGVKRRQKASKGFMSSVFELFKCHSVICHLLWPEVLHVGLEASEPGPVPSSAARHSFRVFRGLVQQCCRDNSACKSILRSFPSQGSKVRC